MAKSKDMRSFFSGMGRVAIALMTVFLIVYFVTVLSGSSDFFDESAEKNASLVFEEDIKRAEALANAHYDNLYEIVEKLGYSESKEDVDEIIGSYIGSEKFGDLRYYSQGVTYDATGVIVSEEISGVEYITELTSSNKRGCTPIYTDKATELDCIAFFVPVRGSLYVDGILSIVPARNIVNVGSVINDKATAVVIIDESGKVLSDTTREDFGKTIGNDFYNFIDDFTLDDGAKNVLYRAIAQKEKTSYSISSAGGNYTLAISPISTFEDHLVLISLSESNEIGRAHV